MTPGDTGTSLSTDYEYTDSNGTLHAAVTNGTPTNAFNPPNGYGDTPSGGHGPDVANVPCQGMMSDNYHIHVFIGIYYQGQELALPTATGIVEPIIDSVGDDMKGTKCFYFTHTHDSTGVLHIESDNGGIVENPPNDSHFNLGQYFQVWGITVSCPGGVPGCAGQFGPYSGPMEIFTSGATYRGGGSNNSTTAENTLQPYYGDPNQIPLWSHEVIWFLIGPPYPSKLPSVHFDEQY